MEQKKLLVKLENAGVHRSSKWLVRGISFEINQGQIVTLIGLMVQEKQRQPK